MADTPNDPGRIDIDLQLTQQTEIQSLVAAVATLAENVKIINSFASEYGNEVEQNMVRGFATERSVPFEREVPIEAQRRLEAAARAGASDPSQQPTEELPVSGAPSDGSSSGPRTQDEHRRNAARARDELARLQTVPTGKGSLGAAAAVGPGAFTDKVLYEALPDPYVRGLDHSPGASHPPDSREEIVDPYDEDYRDVDNNFPPPSGPSLGSSSPEDALTAADPIWRHSGQQSGITDPIRMPRFGEFTAQDYLRMAARAPYRLAESRYLAEREALGPDASDEQIANITAGQFSGRVAASLGQASEYMPYLHQAGTRIFGIGQAPGVMGVNFNASQIINEQEQRGFSGAGATVQDVPGLGSLADAVGFNVNLPAPIRMVATEAGREAIGEQVTRLKERFDLPGLTNEEQMTIEEAITSTGRGLQGNERREQQMRDLLYPLLSNRSGMNAADPSLLTGLYTQLEQHGVSNMEEFADVLDRVPDAAAAAGVGVNEMLQQMDEMGNFFQNELGGRFQQGINFAAEWSRITGTPAPIGQAALSNPMVQGLAGQRYGIMPQQIGMLPGGALTSSVYDTMDLMMNTFKGATPDARVNIPGVGRMRINGNQGDIALAASQLGMSPEVFESMYRRREQGRALATLSTAARSWESGMLQTDPSSRARQRLLTSRNPNDQIASRAELTDLMRQAKFSRTERENVASAMRKSPGAGRAAIERISKDKTAKDRDRLERETKHRVSVDVEFVGEAKNWLKRSRLGNDDRFVNAENARKGKSLANSLFAEAGAPASKRERQRIVQMAQEDPKGFAEQVDHDNLRYEGEDRNPAAEANDWMMGKIVDPATFGMASRANEAGEDIADEIQETGIPDLSPWKGAVPW